MGWCYQSDDSLKAYVRMKLFIIKARVVAKGLCLNFFIHHSLDKQRTITQSNQEFLKLPFKDVSSSNFVEN